MPPALALLVWLILLLALWHLDPAKEPSTSAALWIPLIWMFLVGSRSPSLWLGLANSDATQALAEGNPVDRTISSLLILLAIAVLVSRSFQWRDFFARNAALVAFMAFAMLSVAWSDFPFVTFKKWFRDLGAYVVTLVILSDPRPLEAVRTVLRRVAYLLIPLSIVLIKYYMNLAVQYDVWSGQMEYTGAATSKNMLGLSCMVTGIFFFWDTLTRWAHRKERRTKLIILVNLAFIGMNLWLLNLAHSSTSTVCLVLGCLVIAAVHIERFRGVARVLAPASFLAYVILAWGFGLSGALAGAVGRDPTVSDRTRIWSFLLSMQDNPILGAGYQSFFLGSRISTFWKGTAGDNVLETHNGYLGVYLELGIIGLSLLFMFLIASYHKICKRLKPFTSLGSLSLAFWTVLLFYNVTEAAFELGLLWIIFLMGAMRVPEGTENRVLDAPYGAGALRQVTDSPFQMAGEER
jgi:hypothetical protein